MIVVGQEESCSGDRIAGGEISGDGNFTHLGRSEVSLSSAWDIGDLLDPGEMQYEPVSPAAAGAVAPVLSTPYSFNVKPFERSPPPGDPKCKANVVTATAELVLTAANGDQVFGNVVGGNYTDSTSVLPGPETASRPSLKSLSSETRPLSEDSVNLRSVLLDISPRWLQYVEGILSVDERGRARRFVYDRDRRRFVAAREFLRVLLAQYLNCRPEDVVIGRPVLGGRLYRCSGCRRE